MRAKFRRIKNLNHEEETESAEKWVIERRKFFIKLGWVILFIFFFFEIVKNH